MLAKWFAIPLWMRTIAAMTLGIIVGYSVGPDAASVKWIGDFFIASIKMLVVPLIFTSLVTGVASIGDIGKLGRVGGRAILLFVITGQIAAWLGLFLGTFFNPAQGVDMENLARAEQRDVSVRTWQEIIIDIVPQSPVQVMADINVLPLIIFSLLIGIGILLAKEEGKATFDIFQSAATVMQKITILVMELTPFGVFALMMWVAGTLGVETLKALASLVALNYIGCLLIIMVIYSLIIKFLAKMPVLAFFRGILGPIAVSYSTASSNATLPVTLRSVQRNLGVSESVSSFIVSLGATINMNGTAMYLGLATLFGAELFGIELSFIDYVIISITATLGAVGAAGVPGAGLIMMTLVFSSVGVPLETIAIVAGVDRIMDMMRTTTNVSGDATVATAVAAMTGELDRGELVSADDT